MKVYEVINPTTAKVPVILSIPHSGTFFPETLREQYSGELIGAPEDTDWFLEQLYDFAAEIGITTIRANYSRWVIDLNRDPNSSPLYNDGRIITDLLPSTTFSGKKIYNEWTPGEDEKIFRLDNYYWPYYEKIHKTILELKKDFSHVLLWDAHSIRQKVPSIQLAAFPDLILGDNDVKSASPMLINKTIEILNSAQYSFAHNQPFKGGHITRYFGKPSEGVHALQLEMTKINYMDEKEMVHHDIKASQMKALLKKTLDLISKMIQSL